MGGQTSLCHGQPDRQRRHVGRQLHGERDRAPDHLQPHHRHRLRVHVHPWGGGQPGSLHQEESSGHRHRCLWYWGGHPRTPAHGGVLHTGAGLAGSHEMSVRTVSGQCDVWGRHVPRQEQPGAGEGGGGCCRGGEEGVSRLPLAPVPSGGGAPGHQPHPLLVLHHHGGRLPGHDVPVHPLHPPAGHGHLPGGGAQQGRLLDL